MSWPGIFSIGPGNTASQLAQLSQAEIHCEAGSGEIQLHATADGFCLSIPAEQYGFSNPGIACCSGMAVSAIFRTKRHLCSSQVHWALAQSPFLQSIPFAT